HFWRFARCAVWGRTRPGGARERDSSHTILEPRWPRIWMIELADHERERAMVHTRALALALARWRMHGGARPGLGSSVSELVGDIAWFRVRTCRRAIAMHGLCAQ